jgi:ParB-like chromosome segregation protein Spo0J
MPASFNVEMKRDAIYKCMPENIEVRPELNGRQDKPDIEWLISDILKHGQLQPVGIWSDAGTPVLSYGFSRWRAISEINKRGLTPQPFEIKCTFLKTNEQGAFVRNISENRMRNETTPIDDAHNIQRLLAWMMTPEQVANVYFPMAATVEEVKKAVKWVNDRVELIKLTPEAEQAVISGRLTRPPLRLFLSSQQPSSAKRWRRKERLPQRKSSPRSRRNSRSTPNFVAGSLQLSKLPTSRTTMKRRVFGSKFTRSR